MLVKAESCWTGSDIHVWLLSWREPRTRIFSQTRFRIEGVAPHDWNRATATVALDLLQDVYGLYRGNVRFLVH